jgi:hypothetical protein
MAMPTQERESSVDRSSALVEPYEVDYDDVTEWMEDKNDGKPATLRGTWMHGFSVSSAYWDPSGTRILSTCYDDHIRGVLCFDAQVDKADGSARSMGPSEKVLVAGRTAQEL